MQSHIPISQTLLKLMSNRGLKYADLSRETGIPATTINYILGGLTENPRIDTCMILAQYFGISLEELCFGNDKKTEKHTKNIICSKSTASNLPKIPVLRFDLLKEWRLNREQLLSNHKEWVVFDVKDRETFAVLIESLARDLFPKNSIIVVQQYDTYHEDDIVIASINMNKPSIFRIIEEDILYLQPISGNLPAHKNQTPNFILGKVIESRIYY